MAWWTHWLASVCSGSDLSAVERQNAAFPLAIFDVLLAKVAGSVITSMEEGERETFLREMKEYVLAMRTTSEAKAQALAAGQETVPSSLCLSSCSFPNDELKRERPWIALRKTETKAALSSRLVIL